MKQIIAIAAFITLSAPGFAIADSKPGSHGDRQAEAKPMATAPAGAPMTDGEVRKIDKEQGKITLKHSEIKNLDMPGMTMVFRVADPKMLDAVKEGDKIKFDADKVNGAFTVTKIESVK